MKPVLLGVTKASFLKRFILLFPLLAVISMGLTIGLDLSALVQPYQLPMYSVEAASVVLATVLAWLFSWLSIRRHYKKLALITFTVSSMADGNYHYVQTPSGISSRDFLKLFYEYLSTVISADKVRATLREYQPYLVIKRSEGLVDVGYEQSLADAGIKPGEVCQIKGKPKRVNV